MIAILIGAGVLGIIIAVMEDGDFPGWFSMIICVLAASVPAALINSALPPIYFFVGLIVGAGCAAVAISATCGMSFQRSLIAAGIYLGIQVAISALFVFLL